MFNYIAGLTVAEVRAMGAPETAARAMVEWEREHNGVPVPSADDMRRLVAEIEALTGVQKRFFVEAEDCRIVSGPHETLADAVLAAATHDGYGAAYARDGNGNMRLCSSGRHIGNNVYTPTERDAFAPASALPDDDEAIAQVAERIYRHGALHSHYKMGIVEVSYDDAGKILTIGNETLEQRTEGADDPAEAARRESEIFAMEA